MTDAPRYGAAYARLGWPVFPLRPGEKRPAVASGFKAASTDSATVAAWWNADPARNVGIATGPWGFVLDIDPQAGGDATLAALVAKYGPLPPTLEAVTRNGGRHLYFAALAGARCSAGSLGPGLDIRADGGYVVAPPSVVPADPGVDAFGLYYWTNWEPLSGVAPVLAQAPAWLAALVLADSRPAPVPLPPGVAPPPPREVTADTLLDLADALLHVDADDRGTWVRMGQALKHLGDAGFTLWDDYSQRGTTYDADDQAYRWSTFQPTAINIESVFYAARQAGWIGRGVTPQAAFAATPGASPIPLPPAATSLDSCILSLANLDSYTDRPLPHFVDRWIPQGEVTLLAGHGGGGKSYTALSIAVHVALGRPFGNLTTTQAPVLFYSGEDNSQVLRRRLARLCRALRVAPAELDGKLIMLDVSDLDPALHREQRVESNGRKSIVLETALLDSLARLVQQRGIGLTIIDNASDAYDDDEIKRARVRAFIRSLRTRLARPDRAVLLLCHINKSSATNGKSAGAEDYSGSTAWHNSVRSRLSLIPDGDNAARIEHLKANLGPKAGPVRLQWVDGVPTVVGGFAIPDAATVAQARQQDVADMAALAALIQDFDRRGERVTTAMQGPVTIYKQLSTEPNFPNGMTKDRLSMLLRVMERDGVIHRQTRKVDSKNRVFYTAQSPLNPAPEPRYTTGTPQVQHAEISAI